MAIPEKYSHIDFTPPRGVRKQAEHGLKMRREYGRGGTAVGIARARDLANGKTLSPSTMRRMKAFFDRHQSDRTAPGFKPGSKEYPSNGLIASKLWGHDAGYSWAKKVVAQMNAADEKRSLRPYGSTHGIKPKVFVVHGPPSSKKSEYVAAKKGDEDVVFDFNRVMDAISGGGRKESLVSYCTDIRSLIIDRALSKKCSGRTWIIATRVGDELKSKLSDIPVEYVHIEASKEECLLEVTGTEHEEEMRRVIEEYFSEQSSESRFAPLQSGVERRFLGNFSGEQKTDPDLLKVERRADPTTGKPRTYVVGYAARFGTDSLLLGDFVERIDPSAFSIVEKREDGDGRPLETRCLYNHDPNHLLGRFPTTMRLTVDSKGLKYECLLPESRSDIAESIERGDLKGSSFSFIVSEGGERWSTENGRSIRVVTGIKSLLDCGPVTYPAYGDSTVAVAKRSHEQYRAFCATGKGGGIDNSCGGAAPAWPPAGIGTAVGGAIGAIGGLPGAAIGAHIGMAVDSYRQGKSIASAEKKTGIAVSDLDKFAKGLGKSLSVTATKNGELVAEGDGITVTVGKYTKDEVGKDLSGKIAHIEGDVTRIAGDVTSAAKSLGVKHVTASVASADSTAVLTLRENGFSPLAESSDKSTLTMVKSVGKSKARGAKRSLDGSVLATVISNNTRGVGLLGGLNGRSLIDARIEMLRGFAADRRGFCPTGQGGGVDNSCGGKYMEWDSSTEKEAQDFIDRARKDQTTSAGKSGGKSDDASGVQTWSKGDHYPWTVKQVGDNDGYLQGQHPDGSMTEQYHFKDGDTSAAEEKLSAELKSRTSKRYLELKSWAQERKASW